MRNLRLLFLVGLATGFISEKLFVSSQTSFSTTDDMYLEGRTSGDLPIDDEDGDDDGGSGSGSGDSSFSNFTDKEEILRRFLNFSQTTVSKETVPVQPQPTAVSPQNPSTTTAGSQHPSTKVKDAETTPFILPNGDNTDEKVAGPIADWFTESPSSTSMSPSDTTASKFGIDITAIKDTDEESHASTPDSPEDNAPVKDVILTKTGQNEINDETKFSSTEEVTSENMWERTEVLAAVIACGVVGFLCAVFLLLLVAYRMKKKDEGSYDLGDTKVSTTAYHKAPTKEFYA